MGLFAVMAQLSIQKLHHTSRCTADSQSVLLHWDFTHRLITIVIFPPYLHRGYVCSWKWKSHEAFFLFCSMLGFFFFYLLFNFFPVLLFDTLLVRMRKGAVLAHKARPVVSLLLAKIIFLHVMQSKSVFLSFFIKSSFFFTWWPMSTYTDGIVLIFFCFFPPPRATPA